MEHNSSLFTKAGRFGVIISFRLFDCLVDGNFFALTPNSVLYPTLLKWFQVVFCVIFSSWTTKAVLTWRSVLRTSRGWRIFHTKITGTESSKRKLRVAYIFAFIKKKTLNRAYLFLLVSNFYAFSNTRQTWNFLKRILIQILILLIPYSITWSEIQVTEIIHYIRKVMDMFLLDC